VAARSSAVSTRRYTVLVPQNTAEFALNTAWTRRSRRQKLNMFNFFETLCGRLRIAAVPTRCSALPIRTFAAGCGGLCHRGPCCRRILWDRVKRLKLWPLNLVCMFPGIVRTWPLKNFCRGGVARVTWPPENSCNMFVAMVTLAPCKSYCYYLFIDSEWRCLHGCPNYYANRE